MSATASELPVVREDDVRAAMSGREERPLVLVDLAVPADVERSAGDVHGVRLFDVDDLRVGLDGALSARLDEVPSVEAIVEEEVAARAAPPRARGRAPRGGVAAPGGGSPRAGARARARRSRRRRPGDGGADRASLALLVKKLLHEPTVRLRERAGTGDADEVAAAVRELFGLASPREP